MKGPFSGWPTLCRLDLERTGSVGELLTDCAHGWAVRIQLSRRRPVGGLRLRGATDDGPPHLLPSTRLVRLTTWPQ